MAITLEPGIPKERNAQLTPIGVVGPVVIEEMFFGTRLRTSGYDNSDVRLHISIRNTGNHTVWGNLKIYDWQEWWGQPEGDDRRWRDWSFTLEPGQVYRSWCDWIHMNFDKTYVRAEVVVNDVVITETPQFYIEPGKSYLGEGRRAKCIQTGPGFALFWTSAGYSFGSLSQYHRRPPTGEFADYVSDFLHFKFTDYVGDSWQTAFLVVPDDDFIGGQTYRCNIMTGWLGPPEVYFNFTA